MIEIRYYDAVDDTLLQFAVVARGTGEMGALQTPDRDTYECPGATGRPAKTSPIRPGSCGRRRAP
jgi:hypothetical protein